jgi:hypothetical protein
LLEGDDDAVLVLEVRRSGRKKLTLDEARAAAAKFLPPEFVAKTEKKYSITFEGMMADPWFIKGKLREELLATNPRILEDIHRFIPERYDFEVASILSHLCLEYEEELLAPIDDYKPPLAEEPRYRNIPQYKEWLKSLYFGAAVQVRIISRSALVANHTIESAAIYTTSPAPGIPISWVVANQSGQSVHVVLPLVLARGADDVVGIFQLRVK